MVTSYVSMGCLWKLRNWVRTILLTKWHSIQISTAFPFLCASIQSRTLQKISDPHSSVFSALWQLLRLALFLRTWQCSRILHRCSVDVPQFGFVWCFPWWDCHSQFWGRIPQRASSFLTAPCQDSVAPTPHHRGRQRSLLVHMVSARLLPWKASIFLFLFSIDCALVFFFFDWTMECRNPYLDPGLFIAAGVWLFQALSIDS